MFNPGLLPTICSGVRVAFDAAVIFVERAPYITFSMNKCVCIHQSTAALVVDQPNLLDGDELPGFRAKLNKF